MASCPGVLHWGCSDDFLHTVWRMRTAKSCIIHIVHDWISLMAWSSCLSCRAWKDGHATHSPAAIWLTN
eukprot:scaffold25548_cov34-Prasinocladus_malaysianus.AAC.1